MTAPVEPQFATPANEDPSSLDYGKTEAELNAQREAAANGVSLTTKVRKDYWSNDEEYTFYLPGQEDIPDAEKQFIKYKKMNEGMRSNFQKKTQTGAVIERGTNNTRIGINQARDRWVLIETSVTGWRLFRGNEELPFKAHLLKQFVDQADPWLVDELERDIRKHNKWMSSEADSKSIREQIDELEEQYKAALEREEEEKNS